MAMNFEQAISALGDPRYQTLDGLRQLVAQVSVQIPGQTSNATTLLYSGVIGDVQSWRVAEQIGASGGGSVVTIGRTPAADFLNDARFKAALRQITGDAGFSVAYDGIANADGTRTAGMWDIASKSLADAAVGDVRTFTPTSEAGKVFAGTELPALLDNPKVTSIDGIPRQELLDIRANALRQGQSASDALSAVHVEVSRASANALIGSEIRIVRAADGSISALDIGKYFDGLGVIGPHLPAGQGSLMGSTLLKSLTPTQLDVLRGTKSLVGVAGKVAVKGLPFLGLALATLDANAAYNAGDINGAKRIMSDAAAETLLGMAGDVLVGAVIGAGAVALGIGAIPAVIIGVVAGVAVGVLTSETADRLMDYARQGLADRGIDLGIGSPAPVTRPGQNAAVLDVTVNTGTLNPDPTIGLGGSQGGQGTLAAGPGYTVTANANFVDQNGLANTALSNVITNGIRPGNQNLSATQGLLDSLRAQMNDVRETWGVAKMTGALVASAGVPVGTAYSKIQPITHAATGNTFTAEVFFTASGQMIGLTPQANFTSPTQTLVAGTRYVPSTASGAGENWSADGMQPYQASGVLLYRQTSDALPYTDPLALDENGNGIQLAPVPVTFDANADGVREALPWPLSADPLLVLDINGDGSINNGRELIGLSDNTIALNLLRMDSNGDLRLTAADAIFAKLQIWGDQNLDGHAQSYERRSLAQAGIVAIDLDPAHLQTATVAGQSGVRGAVATYADGSTRTLWDLAFNGAPSSSTPTATQANYRPGVDKIHSSGGAVLVAHSASGAVLNLNNSGAAQAMGREGNDTLVGTAAEDWLIGGAGADKFQAGAGSDLLVIDADDKQADIDAGTGIDTALVADDRGVMLNLAQANVEVVYGGFGNDVFIGGGGDNYAISAASGDDVVVGGSVDDALDGDDGNDIVDGGRGDDLIRGGRGQDLLYGGDGNDVIDGGLDDDEIYGGAGGDVVVASGGRDMVDGGEGIDLIELRGNLEDYKFQASGTNSNGSTAWVITDTKNSDGSAVGAGQVSNRDGVQQLRDMEEFSFKTGGTTTTLDLGAAYPLPVNDRVMVPAGAAGFAISATSLVANDADFQSIANPQIRITWVGDAVGGSVMLSADKSTITFFPTAGFSGPMEFAYTIQDKDTSPHAAPTVALINDPSQQGIMKAKVMLVPSGAPTDPDFAKQWYLGAIDAPAAWKAGYTGKGVKVLVLEPPGNFAVGKEVADLNSADLKPNQSGSFVDTATHSAHATAVAGVIGAARNGIGGVGVAYDATLNSVSMGASSQSLQLIGNDLKTMRDYDVVNNSWSYHNDPWNSHWISPNGTTERYIEGDVIAETARSGRQGLGTIMVFGAGNARDKAEDSGLSSLTANQYTISVGAINRVSDVGNGNATNKPFSERGANILVSAPGSSIQTNSTTLQTNDGTVLGSPTAVTNGTSFSAPIVSGVAALMLQANPKLSYRDVQTILAVTAKKDFGTGAVNGTTWLNNKADDWNGSGMHFSADFGFGLVDADAAVQMAESWESEADHMAVASAATTAGALADLGTKTLTFTVTNALSVEQAILSLKLNHTRWSDLVVQLTSPKGTTSVLLDRAGYLAGKVYATNPAGEITFDQDLMSTHFRGESAVGTWTLTVQDAAAGGAGSGTIQASLQIVGTDRQNWKHYTVTDEYTGGWAITPPPAQPSELNASAMSKSVRLDLSGGVSNVGGHGISLGTGLDRLVGGAANDTLIGSAGDEVLIGGGGDDSLNGGTGYDELQGGAGNDVMDGGAGTDLLATGTGNDTLTGGADADIFLVDGNLGSTTTIRDFNPAAGGDTLRIRSQIPFTWGNVTQTLVGNQLTINAGAAKVILEGMTTALSRKQLIAMANTDELPLDEAGHYATGDSIYVRPIGEAKYVPESIQFLGYASDPASLGANSSTYIGTFGTTDMYRAEYVVASHYDLVNLRWRAGTEGADNLVAGAALPPAPKHIDQLVWETNIVRLGRPLFLGKGGDDEILGSNRDEFLSGGADNDTMTGGKGNDYLSGGSGVDQFVFNGGDGQDTIIAYAPTSDDPYAGSSPDAVEGEYRRQASPTASAPLDPSDVLVFHTSDGNVSVNQTFTSSTKDAFTARTVLNYGAGDTVSFGAIYTPGQLASASGIQLFNAQFDSGSPISRTLDGRTVSSGADAIDQMKYGSKTISTLGGNDLVFALANNGLNIDAGSGDDTVYAMEGSNTLIGGDGNDRIEATSTATPAGQDTMQGGQGNDTLLAGSWGAVLYGDDDRDSLVGGAGADTLSGGNGSDILRAGNGSDSLYGDAGNDILSGGTGNDSLFGGADNDDLSGGDDSDELHGGDGDDNLTGGAGNDQLYGDAGSDVLIGGDGDDAMVGGVGDDYLDSGSGNDTLSVDLNAGNDTVANATGVDVLRIAGISSIRSLGLTLIDNGVGAKISWGSGNSLTYTSYNLDTQIWLDSGVKTTLRAVFNDKNLHPDESFQFLSQYDLQQAGDTQLVGTLVGNGDANQLYGGPKGTAVEIAANNGTRYGGDDAAYWYVLGGAGEDSIAGGQAGALLDGGGGDDRIRASNGVTVMRDTFHGGKDILVMPEGMSPQTLRFFRIASPLQANSSFELLGAASKTAFEQKLPNGLTGDTSNSITLPYGDVWDAQRYEGTNSRQHYDTLRVQTVDGKFTIDLLGYFESGASRNNVSSMLFTTEFDAEGNSTNYSIDSLVAANAKDAMYKWSGPIGHDSYSYPLNPVAANTTDFTQLYEGRAIIGGESGTKLNGRVKLTQAGALRTSTPGNPTTTTVSTIVTLGEYAGYRGSATYRDATYLRTDDPGNLYDDGNGAPILNGLPGNQATQIYDSSLGWTYASNVKSFAVRAIALPDYILGFGGDDTIAAGGTYVETHSSGQGAAFVRSTYGSTYGSRIDQSYSYFGYEDQVNGGGGNDSYLYSKGDGGLHIISIDEENAGAEGTDTLNLSWLSSANATLLFQQDGGGAVSFDDGQFYGWDSSSQTYKNLPVTATIRIDGGRNGLLQVDRIVFSDRTVNVQDLTGVATPTWLSVEQRAFGPDKLAYTTAANTSSIDDRYWSLATSLYGTALLAGTPKDDIVIVRSNGLAQGAEGSDHYLIDIDNTDFAVVMLDRSDGWEFGDSIVLANYHQQSSGLFAGGLSVGATYQGKTEGQWEAGGVIPLTNSLLRAYTGGSLPAGGVLEFGKLIPLMSPASTYALSDWQVADGTFDDVTDALIAWQTRDASGNTVDHHVILAGLLDATGHDVTRWGNVYSTAYPPLQFQGLSQGNDYSASSNSSWQGDVESTETLHALGGNDTVYAYAYDVLIGGNYEGGRNIIYGEGGDDWLDGGAGNDSLYGGADQDTLIGGFGNDYLEGGTGADILVGDTGDDVYLVDGSDAVVENTTAVKGGQDEVRGNLDLDLRDSRYTNVENATALGTSAHHLTGTNGDNVLTGNGAGSTLQGLGGDDSYYLLSSDEQVVEAVDGGYDSVRTAADIYQLAENVEDLYSVGIGLSLGGNALANLIVGDEFGNFIDGGDAADSMQGGRGDDIYVVSTPDDEVVEFGGEGRDTVWVNDRYTLSDDASSDIEVMRASTSRGAFMKGNVLSGQVIVGAAGEDTLDGGGGMRDSLYGGAGGDTYIINSNDDTVVESAEAGSDTVRIAYNTSAQIGTLISLGADNYANVENIEIAGSGKFNLDGDGSANRLKGNDSNNEILGYDGNDVLLGAGGDDYLVGGFGADTMDGGAGSDYYFVDDVGDVVIEGDGMGIDAVESAINYTLGAGLEDLVLAWGASEALVAHGNNLSNQLTGNFSNNELYGYDGNDYLWGDDGNDLLNGGSGADIMYGGAGDDTYIVGSDDDNVIENVAEGSDTIRIAYNTMAVYSGTSITAGYGSYANVENIEITGSGKFNLNGDGSANRLKGNDSNNEILGYDGNDVLLGAGGDDYLVGGFGADTMDGGAGSDYYVVDDVGDVVIEGDGMGIDAVESAINYTLGAGLEDLVLAWGASEALVAHGNNLSNQLTGNISNNELYGYDGNDYLWGDDGNDLLNGGSGADILYGGAGDDTLLGSGGSDTIDGDLGNDTYIFAVGAGVDRITDYDNMADNLDTAIFSDVRSNALTLLERKDDDLVIKYGTSDQLTVASYFSSYTGYHIEQFKFSDGVTWDDAAIKSRVITNGNASANSITGYNDGTNRIYGFEGNDYIAGGAMADLLEAGSGDDTIIGNGGADRLMGGAGNDSLDGGAGDDTIYGGTGVDTAFGGVGNDSLVGDSFSDSLFGGDGDDYLAGRGQMDGGFGNDHYDVNLSVSVGNLATIADTDGTTGNIDQLDLSASPYELLFQHLGNDLKVSHLGGGSLIVKDWFLGTAHHLEMLTGSGQDRRDRLTYYDGSLLEGKVQALVDAMASFQPAAGQFEFDSPPMRTAIDQAWNITVTSYSDLWVPNQY